MIQLVERASDRLLGMFVPKVTAKADLCSCHTTGGVLWGSNCACLQLSILYKWKYVCDGCHYSAGICGRYCDDCCQPF